MQLLPNNLKRFNYYLNNTGNAQHLLGHQLFELDCLFNLDPKTKLNTISNNLRIEISSNEIATKQIKLAKILCYLRNSYSVDLNR